MFPKVQKTILNVLLKKHKAKDYKGAVNDYTEAIRWNPSKHYYFLWRGMTKANMGNHKGAIRDLTKGIAISPTCSACLSSRGDSKFKTKDYKGAITDTTKAIELDPNRAIPYLIRAWAKYELGDYSGAVSDSKISVELDPERNIKSGISTYELFKKALKRQNTKPEKVARKNIKTVTPTPDQEATCLKAKDYKGCMEYYSKNPKGLIQSKKKYLTREWQRGSNTGWLKGSTVLFNPAAVIAKKVNDSWGRYISYRYHETRGNIKWEVKIDGDCKEYTADYIGDQRGWYKLRERTKTRWGITQEVIEVLDEFCPQMNRLVKEAEDRSIYGSASLPFQYPPSNFQVAGSSGTVIIPSGGGSSGPTLIQPLPIRSFNQTGPTYIPAPTYSY